MSVCLVTAKSLSEDQNSG